MVTVNSSVNSTIFFVVSKFLVVEINHSISKIFLVNVTLFKVMYTYIYAYTYMYICFCTYAYTYAYI